VYVVTCAALRFGERRLTKYGLIWLASRPVESPAASATRGRSPGARRTVTSSNWFIGPNDRMRACVRLLQRREVRDLRQPQRRAQVRQVREDGAAMPRWSVRKKLLSTRQAKCCASVKS